RDMFKVRPKVRLVTALAAAGGMLATGLVVASSPATAMQPVTPGGSIIQIGSGTTNTLGTDGPYTAVSQRMGKNVFAVRASDGTLERVVNGGNAALDIPNAVQGKQILSLSSSGYASSQPAVY